MSHAVITVDPVARAAELRKKKTLTSVEIIPTSDLPYRLIKKRTGVTLGSFATRIQLDAYLESYPLATLAAKPTKGPRRY